MPQPSTIALTMTRLRWAEADASLSFAANGLVVVAVAAAGAFSGACPMRPPEFIWTKLPRPIVLSNSKKVVSSPLNPDGYTPDTRVHTALGSRQVKVSNHIWAQFRTGSGFANQFPPVLNLVSAK